MRHYTVNASESALLPSSRSLVFVTFHPLPSCHRLMELGSGAGCQGASWLGVMVTPGRNASNCEVQFKTGTRAKHLLVQ